MQSLKVLAKVLEKCNGLAPPYHPSEYNVDGFLAMRLLDFHMQIRWNIKEKHVSSKQQPAQTCNNHSLLGLQVWDLPEDQDTWVYGNPSDPLKMAQPGIISMLGVAC